MVQRVLIVIVIGGAATSHADKASPKVVRVVDERGTPVAGADVQWGQSGAYWECDAGRPPAVMSYDQAAQRAGAGVAKTDADGKVALPAITDAVRAVTADGRGELTRLDRGMTIVVHPLVTVVVTPSCDGPCNQLSHSGEMTSNGVGCRIPSFEARDGKPLHYGPVARGELELYLHDGIESPDERVIRVHQHLTTDLKLAPKLARISGPLVLRGRVTIHGKQTPTENNYSLHVSCGPELTRWRSVDPGTGDYAVPNLPDRECELEITGFEGGKGFGRKLAVRPGTVVNVELDPKP